MINAFRVRNLRAIGDSGDIGIAKINILVGKNSAGKSTLLRVLPLLRQSVDQPTKGPILWFGRLVDFGTFKNAVNVNNPADGITFDFRLSLQGAGRVRRALTGNELSLGGAESAKFYRTLNGVTASITLGSDEADEVGVARRVFVDLGGDQVDLRLEKGAVKSLSISGVPVVLPNRRRWHVQAGKIAPVPILLKEEVFEEYGDKNSVYFTPELRPFSEVLVESLVPFFHGNTSKEKIAEFASTLLYSSPADFHEQLKSRSQVTSYFAYQVEHQPLGSEWVARVRRAVLLSSLSGLFRRIDMELTDLASSVKYVEPIRATAERYYRLQDLAVDEIDSRGENAAMFLNSLSAFERTHLKGWMLEHLGFYAAVEEGSGHVQVKIGTGDGEPKNIADLGFGYSQLLPIILQVWRSMATPRYSMRSERRPILAIEQPELHLHPQFQAQIADVFSAVMSDDKRAASIFVETHSEHIINRFGQLIATGELESRDVQVLVVEPDDAGSAIVRKVSFDDRGFLGAGWPSGFFVPEVA